MRNDPFDVSVIVPFADDEERVGTLCTRVGEHLRGLGLSYEIVAVDEESSDNSVALLSLLRAKAPELTILAGERDGQGFAAGGRVARGRVLWLLDSASADAPFSAFGWAHSRISGELADVVDVERRFFVCRRTRALRALDGARGRGAVFARRFLRRARSRRLRIETPPRPPVGRPLKRLLQAFSGRP